jgi:hypothetical protein
MVITARSWTSRFACLAVVSLVATATTAAASPTSGRPPVQTDEDIPGLLLAVSTLSTTDAWAVGQADLHALIVHWDGTSWTKVDSPSPPDEKHSTLRGVTAFGPSDIWAVGGYDVHQGDRHALIEHWDGASWRLLPGAELGTNRAELMSASALGPDDVWAVGIRGLHGSNGTLIEHWDGTDWTRVPDPHLGGRGTGLFTGVSAVAENDVWAVGITYHVRGIRTLIEHWDGTDWSVTRSPGRTGTFTYLESVSATSATAGWTVGSLGDRGAKLLLRWDGSAWSKEPLPPVRGDGPELRAVSALTSTDTWIAGWVQRGSKIKPLIEHWDGVGWGETPSPIVPGARNNELFAVNAASQSDVWAVGQYTLGGIDRVLLEHWDGLLWTAY